MLKISDCLTHLVATVSVALLCLADSSALRAEEVFPVSNQATLARSSALPILGLNPITVVNSSESRDSLLLTLDWTNEYFVTSSGNETLTLDGESERLGLIWQHALSARWQLSALVPVLHTGGGVLDSAIQGWHSFWGMPNGKRQYSPENQYRFIYVRNGQTVLDQTQGTTGFGDAQLSLRSQLGPRWSAHLMAKLPTGDAQRLTGGNAGGALWAEYDPFAPPGGRMEAAQLGRRWLGFTALGLSVNGQQGSLGTQQHSWVGLAGAGLGYQFAPRWTALTQLYGHTALYQASALEPLRRGGLQLAFGARLKMTEQAALSFGIEEDVIVASSPDFSLHMDYRWRAL